MRYTSSDGLMSSSDPTMVATWERIAGEHAAAQQRWNALLRSQGVKCAHPDDGWVNRERDYLSLSWYPAFDDGVEPGDLIALGSPSSGYRLVRVTRVEERKLLIWSKYYYFEDTGDRLPEPTPSSLWRRIRERSRS